MGRLTRLLPVRFLGEAPQRSPARVSARGRGGTMDDPRDVSRVRGFLLEHPIEEWLAKEILRCLPSPQLLDPRLKKALLLRRLSFDVSSGRLSEDTLRSLELLEELDRSLGAASPPKALVAAYCAVAADVTVSPLRDPRSKVNAEADFFDAVNRIWNCRVADVERSVARGLVGEGLMRWRTVIKEALGSAAARERLLRWNTGWEAAEALREYLRVALKEMGPQLLELVARAVADGEEEEAEEAAGRCDEAVDAEPSNSGACEEAVMREAKGLDAGPSDARGGDEAVEGSGVEELETRGGGLDVEPSKKSLEQSIYGDSSAEELAQSGQPVLVAPKTETERTAPLAGQASVDASMDGDQRSKELGLVPSPEVTKTKEARKSACTDSLLKAAAGPFPDALERTCHVPDIGKMNEPGSSIGAVRDQDQTDESGEGLPVQKDIRAAVLPGTEEEGSHRDTLRPGLLPPFDLPKPAALTPEEDENAVRSPSSSRGAHLATPRRRRVPSLRLQEIAKFVRTRKIKRWTPQEEDALREAVRKHGKGNWKIILQSHREAFEERTEVDLKDKWRNMTR